MSLDIHSARNHGFTRFALNRNPPICGFEHLFFGGVDASDSSVSGLHWWCFDKSKTDKIDYGGVVYNNVGAIE